MSTIIFEEVTKNYGRVQGISNVSLNIGPGVTGILGPNGAGKSTTMKVLLGLARPSIGSVYVDGVNPFDNFDLRKKIGFVPEYDCFYEHMSAVDYVSYFLMIHDFSKEEAVEKAENSLIELGLQDSMYRKIRTYSRGMRQKTKVARATAFNPQILVLDDLIGLNPINVRFVKKYSNIRKEIVKAVSNYSKEVRKKTFPSKKHSY